ncbi:hypothetical protein [Candidatus Uabimicrobium sp. HlEnr_7]|uniref:hypothetical protein n=1 Tax=Candidatus Uabimicrobium helgolandensis TaxID=3095367 RepID=UPI003557E04B
MLHDRTELWLKRIHYLGFIGFSLPLITIVFSFCSNYSRMRASFFGIWEFLILALLVFSVWSFWQLKFKNNTALLACKILLFLLLAMQVFMLYTIVSKISLSFVFSNFQTFTQIANAVTTSLFIMSVFWVMWRFLLPLDFQDEYPDEYAIDLRAYGIGIFASLSFVCASLNHLQIDPSVTGYRISISSGGIVMYGFLGWRIFHFILLILAAFLAVFSIFRRTEWAGNTCVALKLLFLAMFPFVTYTIFSSKINSDLSSKFMMFTMFTFILVGLVVFFHWLCNSFIFIYNEEHREEEHGEKEQSEEG